MSDNDSLVEIKVGDNVLSVSGSEEFVSEHFYNLYEKHGFDEVDVSINGTSGHEERATQTKKDHVKEGGKPLNEYLANSEASTKQDNALVTGWYLESVAGQDDFTPSEVKDQGDSSKVPLGVKLTRDMDNNVKKGYLHSPGQRDGEDTYWVTDTGKEYLEEMGVPV
jgi:hypothetical protein